MVRRKNLHADFVYKQQFSYTNIKSLPLQRFLKFPVPQVIKGNSLHAIVETLDDFASWSGLRMNQNKTELFLAGLCQSESASLASFGFPLGTLPIRYLGLPLLSRKLKVSEYAPLIDKLTAKFNFWAAKSLSFAGRTQLIASVISGIVVFWISTFLLPKSCIKKVEQLCARFLWSGDIANKKVHKLSWPTVCLPREEGGLGLRRYSTWNITFCLRLIWILFSENTSVLAAWFKTHYLGRKSFWEIQKRNEDSWIWQGILKLRNLAEAFIVCQVGNGERASFWYDSWTPYGNLISFIGDGGPAVLRVPLSYKVAQVAAANSWNIAAPRSEEALQLSMHLTTISLPLQIQTPDVYKWLTNGVTHSAYNSKATWEVLRPAEQKVDWFNCVWYKGGIPTHAFLFWTAQHNRLPTKDRLLAWGMLMSPLCLLCERHDESRDHLFLSCPYVMQIWIKVRSRLNGALPLFLSWQELLSWLKSSSTIVPNILRKLIAHSTIYAIWRQRNNQLHNQQVIPSSTVFREVRREIINVITANRSRRKFHNLMQLWI